MTKQRALGIIGVSLAIIAVLATANRDRETRKYEQLAENLAYSAGEEYVIPTFHEVETGVEHQYLDEASYPFAGGTLIDVDGDGTQEIFLSGGFGQPDHLLAYRDEAFVDIIEGLGISDEGHAGYGSASADIDGDGDIDLLVARSTGELDDGTGGVYVYRNEGEAFVAERIEAAYESHGAIGLALGDIDRDGDVDMHATFGGLYQDMLLLNDGQGEFERTEAPIAKSRMSAFVDLDNDDWLDLIAIPSEGKPVLLRNATGSLELVENELPSGTWGGLAIGDYDQDGDADLFLTNTGTTIPSALLNDELPDDELLTTDWLLLRNDGAFAFENRTEERLLNGYELGSGTAFADLNLDGLEDLIVAGNSMFWPGHRLSKDSGRILLRDPIYGTFVPVEDIAGVSNKSYGQQVLVHDFNGDGYPDLLYVNLNGPARAFLNDGGGPLPDEE